MILAGYNDTCIQKVIFIFPLLLDGPEKLVKARVSRPVQQVEVLEPESIRRLGQLMARRLERVATMMEILQDYSSEWVFSISKDYLTMESEDIDVTSALEELSLQGFNHDDFTWKVEYTRKWGFM